MNALRRLSTTTVLVTAFLGIILVSFYRVYGLTIGSQGVIKWLPYAYSDLLIDYDGGFVRRGLLGTLLERIAHHGSALSTTNEFLWSEFLVLTGFCCVLAFMAGSDRIRNAILVLLVPGGLLAMTVGNTGFFRKETLFHTLLCVPALLFSLRTRSSSAFVIRVTGWGIYTSAFLLCVVMPMIHEAFLFLVLPAIILLVLATLRGDRGSADRGLPSARVPLFILVLLGISITEFMMFSVFRGSAGIAQSIFGHLAQADQLIIRPLGKPSDAIDSLAWGASKGISMCIEVLISGWAWYWLVPILAGAVYCLTFVTLNVASESNPLRSGVRWGLIYVVLFVCTLPLFVLGWDWGRWINSTNFTFLILYLAMRKTDLEGIYGYVLPGRGRVTLTSGVRFQRWQSLYAKYYSFVSAHKGFVVFGLILLSQTLKVPECCIQHGDNMWVSLIKDWSRGRH